MQSLTKDWSPFYYTVMVVIKLTPVCLQVFIQKAQVGKKI